MIFILYYSNNSDTLAQQFQIDFFLNWSTQPIFVSSFFLEEIFNKFPTKDSFCLSLMISYYKS